MLIKLVNATADLLKESGYTRLELQLDSTGGHEATYYTAEGQALRALPVSEGVTDEMVERVAQAIAGDLNRQDCIQEQDCINPLGPSLSWDYLDQGEVNFAQVARAALEASLGATVSDGWEDIATLRSQLETVKELLVAEREENLWNAYYAGNEKDGEWTHMCMSDGEWLAQQCGLDPKAQFYNAADVKALIPNAAKAALGPLPAPPTIEGDKQ